MGWQSLPEALKWLTSADWFGVLVAAFSGALGAQFIVGRSEAKKAALAELNAINTALGLCFTICNRFLLIKKQHVLPMRDRYFLIEQEYRNTQTGNQNRDGQERDFQLDLGTIPTVTVPTELLERQVFEKMSIRGRPLSAAIFLVWAIDGVNKSISARNELIAEFRANPPTTHEARMRWYLGLRTPEGVVDERFRDGINAIFKQTDDCIFFVRTLAYDLNKRGKKLRRRYMWKFFLRAPKLDEADWSPAERDGLMPPQDNYTSWLSGFRKRPTLLERFLAWPGLLAWFRMKMNYG